MYTEALSNPNDKILTLGNYFSGIDKILIVCKWLLFGIEWYDQAFNHNQIMIRLGFHKQITWQGATYKRYCQLMGWRTMEGAGPSLEKGWISQAIGWS